MAECCGLDWFDRLVAENLPVNLPAQYRRPCVECAIEAYEWSPGLDRDENRKAWANRATMLYCSEARYGSLWLLLLGWVVAGIISAVVRILWEWLVSDGSGDRGNVLRTVRDGLIAQRAQAGKG